MCIRDRSLSINDPLYESVRISDIEFDQNGVLWILNSRIDSPLKSFNLENNSWNSYDFTEIINDGFQDELGFNDIEVDDYGNKIEKNKFQSIERYLANIITGDIL